DRPGGDDLRDRQPVRRAVRGRRRAADRRTRRAARRRAVRAAVGELKNSSIASHTVRAPRLLVDRSDERARRKPRTKTNEEGPRKTRRKTVGRGTTRPRAAALTRGSPDRALGGGAGGRRPEKPAGVPSPGAPPCCGG